MIGAGAGVDRGVAPLLHAASSTQMHRRMAMA